LAFAQDTAAKTGKSERSVQRAAQRGENIPDDMSRALTRKGVRKPRHREADGGADLPTG